MSDSTKILVPVDFSDCAADLVEQAVEFARRRQASVVLLHVPETPKGLSPTARIHPEGSAELTVEEYLTSTAEERMSPYLTMATSAGVPAQSLVRIGEVSPTILEVSRELPVDMIVMGTHGRTGVTRALMGSVAEAVMRHADCPVTTVRTEYKASCSARSCASCTTHVTPELQNLRAELDG